MVRELLLFRCFSPEPMTVSITAPSIALEDVLQQITWVCVDAHISVDRRLHVDPFHLSPCGCDLSLHDLRGSVHVPGGVNPPGPMGRNPSKAHSSINFSSFSLSPLAAKKDFPLRSAASYTQQVCHQFGESTLTSTRQHSTPELYKSELIFVSVAMGVMRCGTAFPILSIVNTDWTSQQPVLLQCISQWFRERNISRAVKTHFSKIHRCSSVPHPPSKRQPRSKS